MIMLKRVGMKPSSVYFYTKQFFNSHVTQVDHGAEMIQQCKLTGFVGGFEYQDLQSKSFCKTISSRWIESPFTVEYADVLRIFPPFNNDMSGSGVQPAFSLIYQLSNDI